MNSSFQNLTASSRCRLARGLFLWIVSLFAVLLYGCETVSENSPLPIGGGGGGAPASDTLSEGDVIAVSFTAAAELNQSQKIRSDGKVGLPMIGDVRAAGKSPQTLQRELSGLYATHLQDASVLVNLVAPASVVYVSGEVRQPGKIVLDRPLTAFEAIMESGGFSPGANPKKVTLIRKADGRHEREMIDLSGTLRDSSTEAIYLQAYDTLIVGQRIW